jgi:hypothetical protein
MMCANITNITRTTHQHSPIFLNRNRVLITKAAIRAIHEANGDGTRQMSYEGRGRRRKRVNKQNNGTEQM